MSKNISSLSGRQGLENNLFDKLGKLSTDGNTASVNDLEKLADEFLIGKANVYGSATFYDFTRAENKGKKAYVCNGSACLTAGSQDNVKNKLSQYFNADEIGAMCCLGRCHENIAFHINGKNYSGKALDNLDAIVKEKKSVEEQLSINSIGNNVLIQEPVNITTYYTILQDALKRTPDELLKEIKIANVRGRGGAGFPMAIKLESCKNTVDTQKYVVCNADEGDPGAYSDKYLLEQQPHSVILGMILSGYIIGASWGVVYIRAEYPEAINIVEDAIVKLYEAGYLGKNIFNSGFDFDFKIIKAQGAYICGEETALLSSIEGQRPEVRVRPPFPAQQGLFNKPTAVNNVETLACVPFIIKNGGSTFAQIGTEKSKGTKLVCLDGHFKTPGMYEVPMGTALDVVLYELGGGFKVPVKALHIGGPLGGLVPISKTKELSIDFESFSQQGFLLGHASVVCVPESFPLIQYLHHLFEFTAHESCGKCFPCRIGSTRGAELLSKAQNESYKIDSELFSDLLNTLQQGSLCALGGGLPLPVKNALQYFNEELQPYFTK